MRELRLLGLALTLTLLMTACAPVATEAPEPEGRSVSTTLRQFPVAFREHPRAVR